MPEAQDNVSLSLQATPVVEAIEFLDTLLAGERADELRDPPLQWRAGASFLGDQRAYFRKVAAQFCIPLPQRTSRVSQLILRDIAEASRAVVQVAALESLHSAALESLLSWFQAWRRTVVLESLHSQAKFQNNSRHQCDFVHVFPQLIKNRNK